MSRSDSWNNTLRNTLKNGETSANIDYSPENYVRISDWIQGRKDGLATDQWRTDRDEEPISLNPEKYQGKTLYITISGKPVKKASFSFGEETDRMVSEISSRYWKKNTFEWSAELDRWAQNIGENNDLEISSNLQKIAGQDPNDNDIDNFNDLLKATGFPPVGFKFVDSKPSTQKTTEKAKEKVQNLSDKQKLGLGLLVGGGAVSLALSYFVTGE